MTTVTIVPRELSNGLKNRRDSGRLTSDLKLFPSLFEQGKTLQNISMIGPENIQEKLLDNWEK